MQKLIFVMAFAASPLAAQEADSPPQAREQTATAENKAEQPKKICRNIADGMNSRRKTRVCMTAQEWREFNQGN